MHHFATTTTPGTEVFDLGSCYPESTRENKTRKENTSKKDITRAICSPGVAIEEHRKQYWFICYHLATATVNRCHQALSTHHHCCGRTIELISNTANLTDTNTHVPFSTTTTTIYRASPSHPSCWSSPSKPRVLNQVPYGHPATLELQ